MTCPIPQSVIEEADALIAISLQSELIRLLTGLTPALQTPSTLGGLIRTVEAQKLAATPKKEQAHAPA
jgi:hypothetical protein